MNTGKESVKQPRLFVPLLDNGNGDIKSSFMMDFCEAFAGRDYIHAKASDSHANRGMNKVACAFLKTDAEYWVNIDADTLFTRKDIDNLLSHGDRKLVYGLYPKKEDSTPPCIGTFDDSVSLEPDAEHLVKVRRAGRGFMLVHRSLLEMMKEENGGPALRFHNHGEVQWDFFPSGPVVGDESAMPQGKDELGFPIREWISEDWYFCERARALGVDTVVDARISLGHEGPKVYRFGPSQHVRMDSNVKSWEQIHGWFDYENLYRMLATEIPDGGSFAEIGVWKGKSIAAFNAFAKEQGKHIRIHAVDTFCGHPANEEQAIHLKAHGGSTEKIFIENMKSCGLNGELTIHKLDSVEAAIRMEKQSLDAVFIDGDHSYNAVRDDIRSWIKAVKPGGIICGHDYDEQGVKDAVQDCFRPFDKYKIESIGRCWLVKV